MDKGQTSTQNQGLSPTADMELEENYFENDSMMDQEEFERQFDDSEIPGGSNSLNKFNEEQINGTEGMDGADGSDSKSDGSDDSGDGSGDDEPKPDDFNFDSVLAEEEAAELEELNKKLGTDFSSKKELNEALKSQKNNDQQEEIKNAETHMNYFGKFLDPQKFDDEALVIADKRLAAVQNGIDPDSTELNEQIEMEVEQLKDGGFLAYAAKSIRTDYRKLYDENKKVVDDYNQTQAQTKEQTAKQKKEKVENALMEVFQEKNFLGIAPTKEDMIDIYKDISKDKHIEHFKANPRDAVEFALFKKYKKVISENLDKPDYKAGVKSALQELGMSSSQPGQRSKDKAKNSSQDTLSYLEQFAK